MSAKPGDYAAVAEDIKKLLHQPEYDDGSAGPVLGIPIYNRTVFIMDR